MAEHRPVLVDLVAWMLRNARIKLAGMATTDTNPTATAERTRQLAGAPAECVEPGEQEGQVGMSRPRLPAGHPAQDETGCGMQDTYGPKSKPPCPLSCCSPHASEPCERSAAPVGEDHLPGCLGSLTPLASPPPAGQAPSATGALAAAMPPLRRGTTPEARWPRQPRIAQPRDGKI